MTTDEKKTLASLTLIWILLVGIYLFSPKKFAFSYYGILGTLCALPFGMWGVWHLHRTWKPWGSYAQESDDHNKWLIISVVGGALLTNILRYIPREISTFIMSFLLILIIIPYTYSLIQFIRHRPRR